MTLTIVVMAAVFVLFLWLLIPSSADTRHRSQESGDTFIDPDDSYQIGLLVGMTGGSIPDAATMRFALQRFQEIHGRRATTMDIGIVLGLIRS